MGCASAKDISGEQASFGEREVRPAIENLSRFWRACRLQRLVLEIPTGLISNDLGNALHVVQHAGPFLVLGVAPTAERHRILVAIGMHHGKRVAMPGTGDMKGHWLQISTCRGKSPERPPCRRRSALITLSGMNVIGGGKPIGITLQPKNSCCNRQMPG